MGYAVYFSSKNNRWQGYGVTAYCDHPDCKETIDRGMGYVCCGNQEHSNSCGGFYCAKHESLCQLITEDEFEDFEDDEVQEQLEHYGLAEMPLFDEDGYFYHCQHKPIEAKEHPDWIKHVENDESWEEWRNNNPKALSLMKSQLFMGNGGTADVN